jgi:hypothetical protein
MNFKIFNFPATYKMEIWTAISFLVDLLIQKGVVKEKKHLQARINWPKILKGVWLWVCVFPSSQSEYILDLNYVKILKYNLLTFFSFDCMGEFIRINKNIQD